MAKKTLGPKSKGKGAKAPAKKTLGVSKSLEGAIAKAALQPVLPSPPKTLGKRPPVTAPGAAAGRPAKTLGRAASSGGPAERAASGASGKKSAGGNAVAANVLNRAVVRQKIADRLAGKLTPAGLATWARQQWLDVQRGAPAESGQRETLEDSLQQLTLSALPASKLSDDQLIELMTQLG